MSEKVIVFAGQPNTGKSSWINQLSGSKLTTGNWSGVTVEKAESWINDGDDIYHFIDLPGIQGLNHQTDEERITESFLMNEKIDCIVQVMDSCHMESSLSLTLELRKLQIPMICLLNFNDEAKKNQIHIEVDKISRRLSIPMISCCSFSNDKNEMILNFIKSQSHSKVEYRPILNPSADKLFDDLLKWYSLKEAIQYFDQKYPEISLKEKHDAINSCMRYIAGDMNEGNQRMLKIDRFLLCSLSGRILLMMSLLTAFLSALYLGSFMSNGIQFCADLIQDIIIKQWTGIVHSGILSFVEDVIFAGIGSLLSFIPQLSLIYLLISFLEECGIMARISLMMDSTMRCFQLTGKSFITLLTAHGCNVPAVLHSTSLENESIRKKTALLIPFCSCTARLPVYLFFVNSLFGTKGIFVCLLMYGTGCFMVLLLSCLIENVTSSKIPEPQIIELVPYRVCSLRHLFKKTSHQIHHYVSKITRVMLISLSVVWLLMNFPKTGESSWLIRFSKQISLIFTPLGFGKNWIYTAALFPGIIAKEAAAGTLMMLMKMTNTSLCPELPINLSYLVFIALTIPCVMTLNAIQQKYGTKHMLISICLSFAASYAAAWLMVQFIMFFY